MKLLKELIEMGFPPVVKFLKNMYGLRQALKRWSDLELTGSLRTMASNNQFLMHAYLHTSGVTAYYARTNS